MAKISGPLLDRIDLHVRVPRPSPDVLAGGGNPAERSDVIRQRVIDARARQTQRSFLNRDLSSTALSNRDFVADEARSLLKQVAEKKALSARAWIRSLRVARTIADLADSERVAAVHIAEALTFR